MVYRADAVRHTAVPLRCTHYDAFRFFTPAAAPHNTSPLARHTQIDHEQPGCLHAGMGQYRFATKMVPLIDPDLLWRAFTLAHRARELDMQASPHDLADYGYPPVAIETARGRADLEQAARLSSVK